MCIRDRNRTLRGWFGYFQHSKANTFDYVDGFVRRRLRSVLQWRLDGQGKGIGATHQRLSLIHISGFGVQIPEPRTPVPREEATSGTAGNGCIS